jgi:hypothetical protein
VFLTVVKPRPLFVRAGVDEKDLQYVRAGLTGKAVPTALPDLKLPVKVERVSAVPLGAGKFEARLAVTLGADQGSLMPGMTCDVKLTAYKNDKALTVPASAVFADEADEDQAIVYRLTKDGKPEKRNVTVGKKADRKAEIVEGLQEGDEILLEKPDAKKADEKKTSDAKEEKP